MFPSHTSRCIFYGIILIAVFAITLSACADRQEERTATILCPLPYLEMGTEPWCDSDNIIFAESVATRLVGMRMCENRVAEWETAWQDCAEWVREKDEARERGHRWNVYPSHPPAHECKNLAGMMISGRLPTEVLFNCERVLRWWSATHREAALQGYAHKLSLKDEQALQEWMDNFNRPLDQ